MQQPQQKLSEVFVLNLPEKLAYSTSDNGQLTRKVSQTTVPRLGFPIIRTLWLCTNFVEQLEIQ